VTSVAMPIRPFLVELASLDGLDLIRLGDRYFLPALHHHRPLYEPLVEVRSGADIDRLIEDAAGCVFRTCVGRRRALAILETRKAEREVGL
jgi:hypothetical protein